jgi:RHS repeat-associated protein
MVDNSGTTTYAYDAAGRLVGTTQGGVEQRCQYDAVGNRTTMALVGTGTFSYDYDAVDRLKTMVTPAGERYTQQYDADSRRTTLLLGLGSKREYRYDSVGRITTQIEYNAAGQRIYTMVDSYDAVGNRIGRVTNGNATTWLYDDAYRLIGQQKSGQTATFVYDQNSNLTTKWHQGGNPQTMQYDAADRLTTMQSGGTTGTMSWFSRGAMRNQYETGAIKATYSYTDINNNLRVAQDAAGLTTSTYDGDNLRRKIVSGSVTTTFVWDGADYLQIKPSSGDATLLVVLEGEVVGHVKGSEKRDYIVDPLGSVVAYLNSSQTLTDQFEYWPYGELITEVESEVQLFLWVGSLGYFRDSDLRTYIRAREYRQDVGSWMQLDPLWPKEMGYAYSINNPFSVVDPSGTQRKTLPPKDKRGRFYVPTGTQVVRALQRPYNVALLTCVAQAIDANIRPGADPEAAFLGLCQSCCTTLVSVGGAAAGLTLGGPVGAIVGGFGGALIGAFGCEQLCYCLLHPESPRCGCPPHRILIDDVTPRIARETPWGSKIYY